MTLEQHLKSWDKEPRDKILKEISSELSRKEIGEITINELLTIAELADLTPTEILNDFIK